MKENKREMIVPLQGLRVLAFLGIFTSHTLLSSLGAWGVSVFFLMSGFLMAYSYFDRELDGGDRASLSFSRKKIKKLYPLHIFTMLAALLFPLKDMIGAFTPRAFGTLMGKVILNTLLLQDWVPLASVYFSLNGVAWYLSACLFLYALFPRILSRLRWISRKNPSMIYAYICAVYATQLVAAYLSAHVELLQGVGDDFCKWLTYILPLYRVGDFAIGCGVGYLFSLRQRKNWKKSTATVLELLALMVAGLSHWIFIRANVQSPVAAEDWYVFSTLYLPSSVLLVYTFACGQGLISKLMSTRCFAYFGKLSPYAFLIHQVMIRYVDNAVAIITGIQLDVYLRTVLSLAATIAAAECWLRLSAVFRRKRAFFQKT